MKTTVLTALMPVFPAASSITAGEPPNENAFSYANYATVLTEYVDQNALVDYQSLKARPQKLNGFLDSPAELNREEYDSWTEERRIAFWINTCNACVLTAITDHCPIRSSFFKSLNEQAE